MERIREYVYDFKSRRRFGVIAASFFRLKCAENVHIDVKFQRMVHFEFGGFGHVMNSYLMLSFALFWFMYSWMVIFCCEANWFCAVRMSIARWISCFIAMVCGFGHVQYCTLIMNSWMRSFALAVHVLLVTNCKLFVGKWLRPRYIRLRVKWVCCDSIMHDAEADFDVNRIVLVIIFSCT